jgi:chromosomal replication initiator protein
MPGADACRSFRLAQVIAAVAEASGVPVRELLSGRRSKRTVQFRQAAMWLAREITEHSYPAIGQAFNRDHSTVMYGVSRTEERMTRDPAFAALVRSLEAGLLRHG